MKKCKNCKEPFTPIKSSLEKYCTKSQCVNVWINSVKQKQWTKRKSELKADLMTLSDWLKIAQQHFNTFIRNRDKDKGCISCGKELRKGNTDAGHYFSSGGHYNVRFNEDNVHGQCSRPCNKDKSGNLIEYRNGLINRIGIERLEKLDLIANETRKFTIEEVKEIIEKYKNLNKNIKK
jgi:hypothetical protein